MSSTLLDDFRWAVRYARRRPVFALAVVTTLAVSIAAATTAYGLATAILWRPLPFNDASRLVFVWEEVERDGDRHPSRVTGYRYATWRDTSATFVSMALFGSAGFTLDSERGASSIRGVRVSAGYFDTLGIRPLIGRAFAAADEIPGRNQVVVLAHAFWQERFGGRRDVVGETVRLSGQPYTIIGVMPAGAYPTWPVNPAIVTLDPESLQFWVPIARTPELEQTGRSHVFGVLGRLAPGVTEAQARDDLNRSTAPSAPDPHAARIAPLREQFVRDARTPLLALAGAALAVLLIACANLAALYASAFEARRGELSLRAAIGAGVGRLIRQLALEALLLAIAGGAAGMLIARGALATLPGLLPPSIPLLTAPALDLRVAGVALGLAVLAAGILTAWPIARLIMSAPAPRGMAARPRGFVYRALVVAQIAVTVALVVAAGLLAQSLQSVSRQDPGFAIDGVFVADIGLPSGPASAGRHIALAEQKLLAGIAAVPGVRSAAAAYDHPLEANWSEAPAIAGDTTAEDQRRQAELRIVSPGYFESMDVELLDGRPFNERDTLDGRGVAIVNEAFAREIGGRALGRLLAQRDATISLCGRAERVRHRRCGQERTVPRFGAAGTTGVLSEHPSVSAAQFRGARSNRRRSARRCRRHPIGGPIDRSGHHPEPADITRRHSRGTTDAAARDDRRHRRIRGRRARIGGARAVWAARCARRQPYARDRCAPRAWSLAGAGRASGAA